MSVLRWDKPGKVTAGRAPPGVYIPDMPDARSFRARKVGGRDPRIEIRVTVGSQVLIMVRPETVRISMNGPAELDTQNWMRLIQAVWEAKDILWEDQKA